MEIEVLPILHHSAAFRRPETWREKSQVDVTSHIANLTHEELAREIEHLLAGMPLPAH